MANVSLKTLRDRAKIICNDTHVSDEDVNDLINTSIKNLVILVSSTDSDYYLDSCDFTLDNQDGYALPSRIAHVKGVDYKQSSTKSTALLRFGFLERNSYSKSDNDPYRYRVQGKKVIITPKPTSSTTFTLWYTPTFTPLENGTDTFDFDNGWEDYVIIDVAIQLLGIEESDELLALWQGRLNKIEQRIKDDCTIRDQGLSPTATDVWGLITGDDEDDGWD